MDGMAMTKRMLDVGEGPQPYCMTDAQVAAIKARSDAARAARPEPEGRSATVETLRRRRGDVVAMLWAEGRLGEKQIDAAQEILRVFASITRGAQGRVVAGYAERGDKATLADDLPPTLKAAYVQHYAPWRDWAGRMMVRGASNLGDLTLLFVADNLGPRQVAQRLGIQYAAAVPLLQKGLHGYAAQAGWVRDWPVLTVRP